MKFGVYLGFLIAADVRAQGLDFNKKLEQNRKIVMSVSTGNGNESKKEKIEYDEFIILSSSLLFVRSRLSSHFLLTGWIFHFDSSLQPL